jgi:hypothetical protein
MSRDATTGQFTIHWLIRISQNLNPLASVVSRVSSVGDLVVNKHQMIAAFSIFSIKTIQFCALQPFCHPDLPVKNSLAPGKRHD